MDEQLSASTSALGPKPKPVKGTKTASKLPPAVGPFALPPPTPEYYEHNGLRKVKPYMFAFHSYAKERWQGRTILDVYSEFRDRSAEYYDWAIESGAIVLNNEKTTPNTIIKNGDLISNVLHRHEPPVVAGPIRIIYDGRLPGNDGETLVVEKPGSMPVHGTGRYGFNTLLSILKYDYGLPIVHTSNRLDRLTSGVMICSLSVKKSQEMGKWFQGKLGKMEKEYIARCIGEFPAEEIICEEPLLTIDRQLGVNVVHPQGRNAETIFTRLSYDPISNTSVVRCQPITGRSHQIRVHLQFLGHSIANDPIYQNRAAWGENGGKGGVFGAMRGGTEQDREERRQRGEKFMQTTKERAAGSTNEQVGSENSVNAPLNFLSPASRDLASIDADLDASLDRKPHDEILSHGAKLAIAALREKRDEIDGWARDRDMKGVEKAREQPAEERILNVAERVSKGEESGNREEEIDPDDDNSERGAGFCKTCFTPIVPDPKPEQLFIWLHAIRYKTSQWDWSSPMPFWAEPDYQVPLSSILS